MNNISSLKSTKSKCESPKTPGGISKSLLTPCRRVGLSRRWRNVGPSPFVSPLTNDNSPKPEEVAEKKPRKKSRVINTDLDEEKISQDDPKICEDVVNNVSDSVVAAVDTIATPTRSVQTPRKSKSRASVKASSSSEEHLLKPIVIANKIGSAPAEKESAETNSNIETVESRSHLNTAIKVASPVQNIGWLDQETLRTHQIAFENPTIISTSVNKPKKSNSISGPKLKSPNNLTKECVVVIQKKINKNVLKSKSNVAVSDNGTSNRAKNAINTVSQALFDSDSDEAPLSMINKKNDLNAPVEPKKRSRDTLDDDEDFHENIKVTKLGEKHSSTDSKLKRPLQIVKKPPPKKLPSQATVPAEELSSQDSNDNDDFDFDTKKTILIRKTYEKVIKPQKAKSTGSITQRDIDELKARIQMKKNQLLAKTMTHDTEELRSLIKKWKRGCQDALVELMDLMKRKCPENSMQYSEMLRMFNIPAGLVGYDSDNDCFNSPDDASIILSKFET